FNAELPHINSHNYHYSINLPSQGKNAPEANVNIIDEDKTDHHHAQQLAHVSVLNQPYPDHEELQF
ncbi:hypothetical protein AAHH78_42660, partial [Burkholderia pseudomallei]